MILILYVTVSHPVDPFESNGMRRRQIDKFTLGPGETLNLTNVWEANKIEIFESVGVTFPAFPTEIFSKLPSLRHVEFRHADLKSLINESFRGAHHLSRLLLAMNELKNIPKNVFSLAPELSLIDLLFNQISDIEDGAFNLPKLTKLHLSNNNLKILGKGVFSGAENLEEIRLEFNSIETIEQGAFDLPNLKEIYLQYNSLKNLPSTLFVNSPKLEWVFLYGNPLTEIAPVFENAPKNVVVKEYFKILE